ncbi:hypothetical protein CROQUDRAFT_94331 [Cronartium quercuum f. sp. fusiforme G11]|uniref:Uncharacterized protein n=1 Tax=Cronartium quercuum f. sp. fusiforme G11 TaxID=708437 RepID=A0A9P6NG67_9BASI|nr:hypothetical protein CROQUDRAFT_94331 [Cronartium quercuum f. sp. fusiforme G11]
MSFSDASAQLDTVPPYAKSRDTRRITVFLVTSLCRMAHSFTLLVEHENSISAVLCYFLCVDMENSSDGYLNNTPTQTQRAVFSRDSQLRGPMSFNPCCNHIPQSQKDLDGSTLSSINFRRDQVEGQTKIDERVVLNELELVDRCDLTPVLT